MTASFCAICGALAEGGLCAHHTGASEPAWAMSNLIMCDFFHRGRELRRAAAGERDRLAGASDRIDDRSPR